jgi:hypothetical protein
MDGLMAMLLSDRMGDVIGKADISPRDPQVEAMRQRVRAGLTAPEEGKK